MVQDRMAASLEMAMGYLYELVVQDACGARKLTNAEKKKWRGVDFRKESGADVLLINLKSARATSNSDISTATMMNLSTARALEIREMAERSKSGDDNPLQRPAGQVTAVRAIARGKASSSIKSSGGQELSILVGDALWEGLGAGANFGTKIQIAIGSNPVDVNLMAESVAAAVDKVEAEIRQSECVDTEGLIDWPCLLQKYPDA